MAGPDDGGTDADATRSQAPAVSAVPAATHAEITAGDEFVDDPERYSVEGRIGVGGMGTVLSAKGARLGRPVALKVVTADREDLRRRFEREAQVTARLQHPAIVPVYGSGRGRGGQPFYAMKQVTGEPLDRVIRDATTLAKRFALLPNVIAVTEAIAYAHAERVIHRDLKPANILVGAFGETVVIDWGLAKDLGQADDASDSVSPYRAPGAATADETSLGKVMGTPAYMPLEQARGERVDERADVYALGAILYHVLAGRAPYGRADEGSVPWESMLARVIAAPPAPLSSVQPDLPPDLLAIVARAMARAPADRYPSAGELAADLERFQTGQLVGAHRYSTWALVARWARRHRGVLTVSAIALAVVGVLGVIGVQRVVTERDRAEANEREAISNHQKSEDLVDFMSIDVQNDLAAVGKLELYDVLARRILAHYEASPLDDSDSHRRYAEALQSLASVANTRGDATAAVAYLAAAAAVIEPVIATYKTMDIEAIYRERAWLDAATTPWARANITHFSVRLFLVKQAVIAGNVADGAARYRRILDDIEALPGHPAWARALTSTAWFRIGLAQNARGDSKAAAEAYAKAIAIDRVRALDPTEISATKDLTNELSRLAESQLGMGDPTAARKTAQELLDVLQPIATRTPSDSAIQISLALAHHRMGEILEAAKQRAAALESFQRALAIEAKLVEFDRSNLEWKNFLAATTSKVGDQYQALRDLPAASTYFEQYRDLADELAAANPASTEYRTGSMYAHMRIAVVLKLEGKLAESRAELVHILAIGEAIFAASHNQNDSMGNVYTLEQLGDLDGKLGKPAEAEREIRQAIALAITAAASQPANQDWADRLLVARFTLGQFLEAAKRDPEALATYREMSTELDRWLTGRTGSVEIRSDGADGWELVGAVEARLGKLAEAEVDMRRAVELKTKLAAENPGLTAIGDDAVNQGRQLGEIQLARGDRAGACASATAALARFPLGHKPDVEKKLQALLRRCGG